MCYSSRCPLSFECEEGKMNCAARTADTFSYLLSMSQQNKRENLLGAVV